MNNTSIDEQKLTAWRNDLKAKGLVWQTKKDEVAYNVDGTKEECPPDWSKGDWDEYWKYCTGLLFTGQVCASCGATLTVDTRVGAHIRISGELEDEYAWITLYCKGCNNSNKKQQATKGSWLVRTKMSKVRKNVKESPKTKE